VSVLVFRNRQRTKRLNIPLLRRVTLFVLRQQLDVREHQLCFHLVNAPEMAQVNETFLQHIGSTDVITFDHAENPSKNSPALHGEIFISVPDAVAQAREFKTTWQSELVRYVIHGLLHLRGFDDLQPKLRREMKREENRLVKLVEAKFPLRQLTLANTRARKP
jgi:probable rRNA maturation factor